MNPNLGMSDGSRQNVVTILNDVLADEYVLYTKTRNYHWNVVGPQFNDLHKFFEAQYGELNDVVDDVAERARTLGGHDEFSKRARLTEHPGKYPDAAGMLKSLLQDHEAVVRQLRVDLETVGEKYRDVGDRKSTRLNSSHRLL